MQGIVREVLLFLQREAGHGGLFSGTGTARARDFVKAASQSCQMGMCMVCVWVIPAYGKRGPMMRMRNCLA